MVFSLFFILIVVPCFGQQEEPTTTPSPATTPSPSTECNEKIGISDPDKVKSSQIRLYNGTFKDNIRLREGEDYYFERLLGAMSTISVDLLSVYNITAIVYRGKNIDGPRGKFAFRIYYHYNNSNLRLMNWVEVPENGYRKEYQIETHNQTVTEYFSPRLEARYFVIQFENAYYSDSMYALQFELLGCKEPEPTTTTSPTTTPSPTTVPPCYDNISFTAKVVKLSYELKDFDLSIVDYEAYKINSVLIISDNAKQLCAKYLPDFEMFVKDESTNDFSRTLREGYLKNSRTIVLPINEEKVRNVEITIYYYTDEPYEYRFEVRGCEISPTTTTMSTITTTFQSRSTVPGCYDKIPYTPELTEDRKTYEVMKLSIADYERYKIDVVLFILENAEEIFNVGPPIIDSSGNGERTLENAAGSLANPTTIEFQVNRTDVAYVRVITIFSSSERFNYTVDIRGCEKEKEGSELPVEKKRIVSFWN